MKMDSLGKSSPSSGSSSLRSGSAGSSSHNMSKHGHHQPRVEPGFRETAHFANIMVEFETHTREMAVDVPDSFIAQTKTPPKYPPPRSSLNHNGTLPGSNSGSGRSYDQSNGSFLNSSVPPLLSARDHLKIEKDGNLLNTREGPEVPPSSYAKPTEQQSQRMKKYSDEIVKKNLELEKKQRSDEFLRQSLRNSHRLGALKEPASSSPVVSGVANSGYVQEEAPVPDLASLMQSVERLSENGVLGELARSIKSVVGSHDFQKALTFNQKVHRLSRSPQPVSSEAQDLTEECMTIVDDLPPQATEEGDFKELAAILCKESTEGLLFAHDRIAAMSMSFHAAPGRRGDGGGGQGADDALLDRLSHYSEPNIKVVRIEKTSEQPLGATVKNEEDAVVVGRIIRGGTAEASGLLHEGDEILEVNEVPMRGKNINEVCDLLANMKGTLTLLVVPTRQHVPALDAVPAGPVMHVKAHIDYDPEDDIYLPCRELGISFYKGDILHVINQKDPHWWQARREGEDDSQLPGLIPSASFQQQREAVKHTIAQDSEKRLGNGTLRKKESSSSTGFLCAKRSGRKKRRKVPYLPDEEGEGEEVIAYEEVALYYPRSDRKRPVVLIGPPNIGRHELRQRLMQDGDRFAAAIPHTSRTKRADEIDGQDYHFISRLQFEQDILSRKFVEHGEYEKSYYGTSLEAIRSVVLAERICVLNLHPQSLRILKSSDLMPFVTFVAPPSLEKLRRWKLERSEPVNDEELKEIIERAREMEEAYGHYFDMVIIYSDPERAYQELLREINLLEREPQWVPGSWLARNSF